MRCGHVASRFVGREPVVAAPSRPVPIRVDGRCRPVESAGRVGRRVGRRRLVRVAAATGGGEQGEPATTPIMRAGEIASFERSHVLFLQGRWRTSWVTSGTSCRVRTFPCLEGCCRVEGAGDRAGLLARVPEDHRCGTASDSHRTSLQLRQFDIVVGAAYAPHSHDATHRRPSRPTTGRSRPRRRPRTDRGSTTRRIAAALVDGGRQHRATARASRRRRSG